MNLARLLLPVCLCLPASAQLASPEAAIERGRVLLEAGRALEAEALFAALPGVDDQLPVRTWLLRAWIEQGRCDEVLLDLDRLSAGGAQGPDLDYLYGLAFARRAEQALAEGSGGGNLELAFVDATTFLTAALSADPARYRDAYLPLARAAWAAGELKTAQSAADRAVALRASDPEAWRVRGRVALARFLALRAEPSGAEAEEQPWREARDSFRQALIAAGTPQDEAGAQALSGTAVELAHTLLWRQERAAAGAALATAMAWAPQDFDYASARELLSAPAGLASAEEGVGFRAALEEGLTQLVARGAAQAPGAGVLCWWLGWARFEEADWSGAQSAFLKALEGSPELINAWFYVGLARQYAHDSEGALAALHSGWEGDADTMVDAARRAGGSLRAFEALIGWCATREPALNLEAAFLAELLARAFPGEPRHWNNLGLFLRDEGEGREFAAARAQGPDPDPLELQRLYRRSLAAYEQALELAPDDPQLLNDTALLLQYHLQGDPARVEAMYRRALELCTDRLAAPTLSSEDAARFEQTRSDALGNLKRLLEPASDRPAAPGPR